MEDVLKDLLDERAVIAVGLRYARSLDSRDFDGFISCFTPDARYGPDYAAVVGHAAIRAQAEKILGRLDATQHMTTNFEVTLGGDSARMRSYYFATHMRRGDAGEEHFVLAGIYEDQLVRTSDGWRIAVRDMIPLWNGGDPAVFGQAYAQRFYDRQKRLKQ